MVELFAHFKNLLEALSGLDRNVLHVHLGIVLFGLVAWIFPGRRRFLKAWYWLLVIELVNECFDIIRALDRGKPPNWADGLADIINTMLWPTVFCLWWYWRRARQRRHPGASLMAAQDTASPASAPDGSGGGNRGGRIRAPAGDVQPAQVEGAHQANTAPIPGPIGRSTRRLHG